MGHKVEGGHMMRTPENYNAAWEVIYKYDAYARQSKTSEHTIEFIVDSDHEFNLRQDLQAIVAPEIPPAVPPAPISGGKTL